jgi:hypothetical protein
MKLKALVGALVVGALGAAVAFAAPAPNNNGRGHTTKTITTSTSTTIVTVAVKTTSTNGKKPPKTGPGCRPRVTLVAKGPAAGDGSATISPVTGGNKFAKLLIANKGTLTVTNTTGTKVSKSGAASNLGSIKKGDHLLETFSVCLADVSGKGTTLAGVQNSLSPLAPKNVVDQGQ